MIVRLRDFYEGAVRKTCICSLDNGKGYTNKTYEFLPDTDYEFHDPTIIKFFKGEIGDVQEHLLYTPELVAQLKASNIPYEVTKCSSCPAAKPHVWFNPFEIEEDDNDNIA